MKKFYLCFGVALISAMSIYAANERIVVIDEGTWQADNARLTLFEDGAIVSNQWFKDCNGVKLGDTPTDIIRVTDNLYAIALNTPNLIQLIDAAGKSQGEIIDIPNVRKLASDDEYIYATSYAHECITSEGKKQFTKGFVAKINPNTHEILSACEVGYEPEGIAYRNGYLYIGNSGGYAFTEDHDFETTISIVDTETMVLKQTIDTGCKNLYGEISVAGKYLCLNASGDYATTSAAGIVVDTEKALNDPENSFVTFPYPVTYNTPTSDGLFYTLGTQFSYATNTNEVTCLTINPEKLMQTKGEEGLEKSLPGTLASDIEAMAAPYDIYCNPYSGIIYATDADNYTSAGKLYQWTSEGKLNGVYTTYINPGHIIALPGSDSGVDEILNAEAENSDCIYDILGRKVSNPAAGNIYIKNGKKFIYR